MKKIDVNECLTNNGGCHEYAKCTNIIGSRFCGCKTGYSGDGYICRGTFLSLLSFFFLFRILKFSIFNVGIFSQTMK